MTQLKTRMVSLGMINENIDQIIGQVENEKQQIVKIVRQDDIESKIDKKQVMQYVDMWYDSNPIAYNK